MVKIKCEVRFGEGPQAKADAQALLEYLDNRALDNRLVIGSYGWAVVSRCEPGEMHQYGAAVKELLG